MNQFSVLRSRWVQIAAGVVTLFALADASAQVTVAFGGPTGTSTSGVWTVNLSGTTFSNLTSVVPAGAVLSESTVSALAFAPDASSGSVDLLATNALTRDFLSLPGPGFWPPSNLTPGNCTTSNANSVAVDPAGDILISGTIMAQCVGINQGLGIYQPANGDVAASWVSLDNLNTDTGLNPPDGGWGISSVPDAVVAPSTNAILSAGDFIALIGDTYGSNTSKPVVVDYPHSAIPTCAGAVGGVNNCGEVLVSEGQLPLSSGAYPVSLDVSPVDGSLLIATSDGTIWQIPILTSGEFPVYGTPQVYGCLAKPLSATACDPSSVGVGVAWGKIRATKQSGQLFVVATVTNTATGTSSGWVQLYNGTSLSSVASISVPNSPGTQPTGLALSGYKSGMVTAGQCIAPETCDPIGDGVELITIRDYPPTPPAYFPPTATIAEQECDVAYDPRVDQYGHFNGLPLPLRLVCQGLSDSTVLPGYVRGGSGPSGSAFVIIAASADQIAANSNGLEVKIQSTSTPVFPGPSCPQNVHILASNDHSQVETTFAEGHNAFENTGFCYSDPGSGSIGPHKTIDGIGLILDLTSFAPNGTPLQQAVAFTDFKIQNLITTIDQTTVKYPWEKTVLLLGAEIDQSLVNKGHYDCAAELVYLLDQFVRRHRADFQPTGTAGSAVREPNGFGDIIGRLANLLLTIENRIEGKTVTWSDWPLAADPHLCHTNECNVSGVNK